MPGFIVGPLFGLLGAGMAVGTVFGVTQTTLNSHHGNGTPQGGGTLAQYGSTTK